MRYYLDTEFMDDGRTIDLISIGIACEDGRTYYAECSYAIHHAFSPWINENVVPLLQGEKYRKDHYTIATEVIDFCGEKPEFWAYVSAHDWIALTQLFGPLIDRPPTWPINCFDLYQEKRRLNCTNIPKQASPKHHAINDAIYDMHIHEYLEAYEKSRNSGGGILI